MDEKEEYIIFRKIMKTLKVVPTAYDMSGKNFNCNCHHELTDETYKLVKEV